MWKVKRMNRARIIVLTIALGAGGVAAYLASGSGGNPPPQAEAAPQLATVEVLVAKADISLGQTVTPEEMQWQTWPAAAASNSFIRQKERPDAVKEITGSIARSPFIAGEPIREPKLIKSNGSGFMAAILPQGMRAISTEISPETGAGGFILPNDHVDVILTRRDREAEKAAGGEVQTSETVLSNVRVLAIDQNVQEKDGQKVVVGKTATLELTSRQTEMLAMGRLMGTLSLALRSLVDSDPAKHQAAVPIDDAAVSTRVNTVRFGVTTTTLPK